MPDDLRSPHAPGPAHAALAHTLTPGLVGLISVGGVIGAGLFVGSAAIIARTGPVVLVSYTVVAVLVILLMRMLGEMSVASPRVGSFVGHVRLGLGAEAGFVVGWTYWLAWTVTAASEVIAGGLLLRALTGLPVLAGDAMLLLAAGAANLISARAYARAEAVLSLIKLVAIGGFILVGALAFTGVFHPARADLSRLVRAGGFAPHGLLAAVAIVPTLVQTLVGFEIATVAAAESIDPVRSVTYAARSLVLRVSAFYVLSLFMVMCIVPWRDVVVGQSPFALALRRLGLAWADMAMTAVVFVAVASCLNSALYVASRVQVEMAGAGDAPAALAATNRRRVPVRAIGLTMAGVLAIVGSAIASPDTVYMVVLSCAGTLALFDYVLAALAQIRLRRAMDRAGERPVFAMWCFPWLSWVVVAAIGVVLIDMAVQGESRRELLYSGVAFAVIALTGGLWRRRRVAPGAAG
ncbi:amino acid permease [Ameyamaea chiangmaiensis]|uniref:Amino acid permease n=1 Tax=Ameyamaea chiangmaiensis TaxID=442969 RepID=A0A850PBB9_9PROT|nr:amino acid permease [Ameyamaea chiangmaiensis]MBS4074724.1 amino acid permease [Ameyamaea chiangmaiensis]NVN40233.1 amino acid permease [Ameyamaea chiangmaiensis]